MSALARIGAAWVLLMLGQLAHGQTVVRYYHTDVLGSVVAVTDADRNVLERREYEPYGAQLTPAVQDGPGYTGHVQDAATGLVYMQQRYYDSELGVFLSVDPVTAYDNPIGQFHRYRYANNSPYKFTDPDGRLACSDDLGCREQLSELEQRGILAWQQGDAGGSNGSSTSGPVSRESRNHLQMGGPRAVDKEDWRAAATVYEGSSQYVDSSGPIVVQPGSTAGPLPTNQFYYTLAQRPLSNNGNLESVAASPEWFKPIFHSSGGTGMFDRKGYEFNPFPGPGAGGTRWYIRISDGPGAHNNARHLYLNIYVPVDR